MDWAEAAAEAMSRKSDRIIATIITAVKAYLPVAVFFLYTERASHIRYIIVGTIGN